MLKSNMIHPFMIVVIDWHIHSPKFFNNKS